MSGFEFNLPLGIIRDVAIANVEAYLPDVEALGLDGALNLERVTYTDGARNVVGEYPDRQESTEKFRGFITQTREQREARTALDGLAARRTLRYLFEDVLEGADYGITLAQNDVVRDRATGDLYEVIEINVGETGAGKVAGNATIVGPKV